MSAAESLETLPVTVVIPVFNRADKLGRALASVAAQRPRPPAEVIVVDDCSSDGSADVAAAAGVRVIRHQHNQGEAASDNDGVAAATQPWVAFLDSDDAYLPHFLATLWELREGHVAVAGKALAVNETTGSLRIGPPPLGSRAEILDAPSDVLFPAVRIAPSAVMVRREAVVACGGFDTRLRRAVDLDFDLRLLEQGSVAISPEVVALYYMHEGQSSSAIEATVESAIEIVRSYADREWWSDIAFERWLATLRWDAMRRRIRGEGFSTAVVRDVGWFMRAPVRLRALATMLAFRIEVRRRTSRFSSDGGPSRAVLPRGPRAVAALLSLARRPTAQAVPGSPLQRPLLRLLSIEPVSGPRG